MIALPVVPISADSGLSSREITTNRYLPIVVSSCLFLLLVFCTLTVFVQEAWALQTFQIGIFALVAVCVLAGIGRGRELVAPGWIPRLLYIVPLWGVMQLIAHTTVSSLETREAVLRWGALAGVFFLTQAVGQTRAVRRNFLSAFLIFATAMAVLCLMELFTSGGKVFWIFPTGYGGPYATFVSYNNYAEFVEIALPIALWRAVREGWGSWWYLIVGGILYGSVIGSASRAGTALCTAELLVIIVIGLVRLRNQAAGQPRRATAAMLLMVPVLAGVFTIAVGWQHVWQRIRLNDPYLVRKEFLLAAVDMAKHRPLIGYGLGTFPEVYQRYAIRDFPFYVNHAHNDWAEFAADGGFPFTLLVTIPFVFAIPSVMRNPWGLGLIAIMLHACVDFVFPRPAVSGWMFVLLALLYMSRVPDERDLREFKPATQAGAPYQSLSKSRRRTPGSSF